MSSREITPSVNIESPYTGEDTPGYYASLYLVFSRYRALHRAGLIGPAWTTPKGVRLAPADSVRGYCRHRAVYLPMWKFARHVRRVWDRQQEIERCSKEIAAMQAADNTATPAYLVALGVGDWHKELELLQMEHIEP